MGRPKHAAWLCMQPSSECMWLGGSKETNGPLASNPTPTPPPPASSANESAYAARFCSRASSSSLSTTQGARVRQNEGHVATSSWNAIAPWDCVRCHQHRPTVRSDPQMQVYFSALWLSIQSTSNLTPKPVAPPFLSSHTGPAISGGGQGKGVCRSVHVLAYKAGENKWC